MGLIENKFTPVICAVSGGVDSAVALLQLVKGLYPPGSHHHRSSRAQYKVAGALFMRNWDSRDELAPGDACPSDTDLAYAQQICDVLKVPLHIADFSKDYWNHVFSTMLDKFKQGLTPNPDILCNKFIKFGSLRHHVDTYFGADHFLATGHYAQVARAPCGDGYLSQLKVAVDPIKDQTFFLSQVEQSVLQRALFPNGHLLKSEVRQMANNFGLRFVQLRKESMGLCFVGNKDFRKFLKDYIPEKTGKMVCGETNSVVGTHNGVHLHTIGQRVHLLFHQKKHTTYYVSGRDAESNILYCVPNTDNPKLYSKVYEVDSIHWVSGKPEELLRTGRLPCSYRWQHGVPLETCVLSISEDLQSKYLVESCTPQRAVTPGQYVVFYLNGICLGSAEILRTQPLESEALDRRALTERC